MTGTQQQGQAPQPKQTGRSATVSTITTAVLALAVLGFAAYLFWVHQDAVGGTMAGAVVAHYFTTAHGATATNSALNIVQAARDLLSPQAVQDVGGQSAAPKAAPLPLSAGAQTTRSGV